MVGQDGWIVLGVEAVVGRDALQAVERRLAAPGLGEAVTAVVALYALEGVLAPELTWRRRRRRRRAGRRDGKRHCETLSVRMCRRDTERERPAGMEVRAFAPGKRGCLDPA